MLLSKDESSVKLVGALEKPFYAAVNPLVERLIPAGVRPQQLVSRGPGALRRS